MSRVGIQRTIIQSLAVVILSLGSFFLVPELSEGLDRFWFDGLISLRGVLIPHEAPNPYLVLIAVTDQTRARLKGGLPSVGEVSQILDALTEAKTGPVILDFVFASPLQDTDLQILERSIHRHGMVYLPEVILPTGTLIASAPILREASSGSLSANFSLDRDGILRQWPTTDDPGDLVDAVLSRWDLAHVFLLRTAQYLDPVFLPSPTWHTIEWDALLNAQGEDRARWLQRLTDAIIVVADVSSSSKDVVQTVGQRVSAPLVFLWKAQTRLSTAPTIRNPDQGWILLWLLFPGLGWLFSARFQPTRGQFLGWVGLACFVMLGSVLYVFVGVRVPFSLPSVPFTIVLMIDRLRLAQARYRMGHLAEVRELRAQILAQQGRQASALFHDLVGKGGMGAGLTRTLLKEMPNADLEWENQVMNQQLSLFQSILEEGKTGLALLKSDPVLQKALVDNVCPFLLAMTDRTQALHSDQLDLVLSLPSKPVPFPLTRLDAELAFDILLNNAVEAVLSKTTESRRNVTLLLKADGEDRFILSLSDSGPGIAVCLACPYPRPFRRCSSCRRFRPGKTTKHQGNGYGIPWVLETFREAGIRIEFRSTKEGTTVNVWWQC